MDSFMETVNTQKKRTLEDSLEGSSDTYDFEPTSITSLDEEILESISSRNPGGFQISDDQLFSLLSNPTSIPSNFEYGFS